MPLVGSAAEQAPADTVLLPAFKLKQLKQLNRYLPTIRASCMRPSSNASCRVQHQQWVSSRLTKWCSRHARYSLCIAVSRLRNSIISCVHCLLFDDCTAQAQPVSLWYRLIWLDCRCHRTLRVLPSA